MSASPPNPHTSPSFALISVLALVSLAALTATAFLASARLERQATVSLTQSTILEMALHAGANTAKEMVDYAPSKHFNFVTTYWRGSNVADWTNELGYLLSGAVQSTSIRTSTIYNYYACFSTATMTNLGTNASDLLWVSNNVDQQANFGAQMSTFMQQMTNFGTNRINGQRECTNIPLLGDSPTNRYTSPPVGWVYIQQTRRIPGTTNTTNLPVVRFAFFVQDLCGMIDAERMGGFLGSQPYRASISYPPNYTPGTNPAEISLANVNGTALVDPGVASNFVSPSNRIRYLSPGLIAHPSVGGLSSNDLRYVTTGLRHWSNAYERVPVGLGYGLSWSNKLLLDSNKINNANLSTKLNLLNDITNSIARNCPQFTNRAGGMDGAIYLSALAANMIDYADNDPEPMYLNVGTIANPKHVVGFDNFPLPTIIFDRFSLAGGKSLTVDSYWQFWNCSSRTSPAVVYQINNNIMDTWYSVSNTTGTTLIPGTPRLIPSFVTNVAVPQLDPGASWIGLISSVNANLTMPPGVTESTVREIKINGTGGSIDNPLAYVIRLTNGTLISQINTGYERKSKSVTNNAPPSWSGGMPGLRYIQKPGWGNYNTNPPTTGGDPRLTVYISNAPPPAIQWSVAASDYDKKTEWGLGWAQWSPDFLGSPALWPDGPSSTPTTVTGTIYPIATTPIEKTYPPTTNILAKLSSDTKFTNICELGNIFDPIQWTGATITTQLGWINYNITTNGVWASNSIYGGGSTLRIGRPEHARFAFRSFTNSAGAKMLAPNVQMSASALLDLFCTASQYDESGQINLNTAPAPVLRALAGRVYLRRDPSLPSAGVMISDSMAEAFAQGVMRFRQLYPFYSPSQLSFISTDPSWPSSWPNNAVFGNRSPISLDTKAPGNVSGTTATLGPNRINDEAMEEWFSKVYKLSTTYSRNFRVYVVAQMVDTNKVGFGPVVRKYYNVVTRQNTDASTNVPPASASTFNSFESRY